MNKHFHEPETSLISSAETMLAVITLLVLVSVGSIVSSESRGSDLTESTVESVTVELYQSKAPKLLTKRAKRKAIATADTAGEENHNDDFVSGESVADSIVSEFADTPDRVFHATAFGFHRLPQHYDQTGARELHDGPTLFRAIANLQLDKGSYDLLIRTRNDARFVMDGVELASVAALKGSADGHNPVGETPPLIEPTIKEFAPGNVEKVVTLELDGLPHEFVAETTIGSAGRRPEIGEFCVAIRQTGKIGFRLLGSNSPIAFTDKGWDEYINLEETRLRRIDWQERAERSSDESDYWAKRHAFAKRWADRQEPIVIPSVSSLIPVKNPIDQFIGRALEEASLRRTDQAEAEREARASGLVLFDKDIQPILQSHCIKYHDVQEQGGLRLDSLAGALAGGESGEPAVVPGHPEKSRLIELISSEEDSSFMPPSGLRLNEQEQLLIARWIEQGATWNEGETVSIATLRFPTASELKESELEPAKLVDDLTFLRRVYLDIVGQIPTLDEIHAFEANHSTDNRAQLIERLLDDERWADHWVPLWQDLLAENPNIVKPNLNNTGAFRWWIYESFLDNKSMDRFVTDLIRMRGNQYVGAAGFGMATQNDAPMAAKATILGSVFMGVEMTCARCHDAPFQSVMQEELFAMAAMLERKPIKIPATSVVPANKLAHRNPLIKVSLAPGQSIQPEWMFNQIDSESLPSNLMTDSKDPRELLAAHLTTPANTRFAKSIVNWTWKRYFGRGLVEPATDWENAAVSHPELLEFLARQLVENDYDLIYLAFLTDSTRVATYQITNMADASSRAMKFPQLLGFTENLHKTAHSWNKPGGVEMLGRWDRVMSEQFAYFIDRLSSAETDGGSILDNTIVLYGSSNSQTHVNKNYPLILAGGKRLGLRHGSFRKFGEEVPLSNLFLTTLDCLGAPSESFADSTGEISELRNI